MVFQSPVGRDESNLSSPNGLLQARRPGTVDRLLLAEEVGQPGSVRDAGEDLGHGVDTHDEEDLMAVVVD